MSRLNISFLGTFQITLDRQPITRFRSTNSQGLLIYLVLNSAKPVLREVLATLFWPEESEQNARNNLRQSLFRLRKLLGDLDEPAQTNLLVTRQTVQFNPESNFNLDVHQFLQAADEGDLETAVAHYHGDLLPGFTCDSLAFESWLRQERESLHVLALEMMLEAGRDCLRNGRYPQAQTFARRQLALEPWREQAHRQLMQALALAGDRANALNQFKLCQTILWDELGVEPTPETVTLFEDIKAGRIGSATADDPIRPPVKIRHNLQAFTIELIGREMEISQVSQLLTQDRQRLVSIVGPGGAGKTRLAVALGVSLLAQFRDGVFFVDLAPLAQPDEIPAALATVLNYQAPDKNQPLFPQLLASFRQQQLLLILDNFEHLLPGAVMVNEMLQACPDLAVLVTSRQRLALAGEHRYELGGLNFPDTLTPVDALGYTAVQLFVANARRLQSDFAVTESNVAAVVRICQLVQGMPLSLLLATSWLELLSPAEIAAEIEKSLSFLAAELADLPARQRSLQAVFEHSWQLLTPAEQLILARLSVFRGGFTRAAAEQVTGANLRLLLALVNKSLLQRQVADGRFTMHELLRQFLAIHRRKLDPDDETLLIHCRYFATLMKDNWQPVNRLYTWARENLADKDNLQRAWDYALDRGLAGELGNLALWIWMFNNSLQGIPSGPVIQQAITILRQSGNTETDSVILWLELLFSMVNWGFDDIRQIRAQLMELLPIIEKEPYLELKYDLYSAIGTTYGDFFNEGEAIPWVEKAYEVALQIGDELLIKTADMHRLIALVNCGLHEKTAAKQLRDYLVFFEQQFPGNSDSYNVLLCLQSIYRQEGMYEQAIHYGKLCLNLGQRWRSAWSISHALGAMAHTYTQMGLFTEAKRQHLAGLEWHLAIGQVWQTLGYLYALAVYYTEMLGGSETAVLLLAMIFHHNDLAAFHRQLVEAAVPQIKAEMGEAAFAVAWEEGQGMGFDTAVSLVRSALTTGV